MKTPIDAKDIRKGDLIRWEEDESDEAREYRAIVNSPRLSPIPGRTFLLDRPVPAVVLPTVPTLGWATTAWGTRLILTSGEGRGGCDVTDQGYVDSSNVTAFTPATAVPTAALDELRDRHSGRGTTGHACCSICAFLTAVDAANGDV